MIAGGDLPPSFFLTENVKVIIFRKPEAETPEKEKKMSKQSMKIQDAAKTLGLSGAITPKIVKAARNKMAAQYHPDVAGKAGETMMKLINLAFEALKDFEGEINVAEDQSDYAAEVMERVEAIIHIPEIRVLLVGAWIWIHGTQQSSVSARSKEINTAI